MLNTADAARRYTKRALTVDAMQWDGTEASHRAIVNWCNGEADGQFDGAYFIRLHVQKGQAWARVDPGDWVIRELDGHGFYPCAGPVFEATYLPLAAERARGASREAALVEAVVDAARAVGVPSRGYAEVIDGKPVVMAHVPDSLLVNLGYALDALMESRAPLAGVPGSTTGGRDGKQ